MATGFVGLPDELVSQILLAASTPTFIQLTQTSKKFFNAAGQNRRVLLHHLRQIPGDKSKLEHDGVDNQQLFLLLRQRASNTLTGVNFTANLHEYLARDVPIDPNASSIGGLDADYVRMALSFKGSADIRQYTSHCAIKEKIRQISGPGVKVLKLVQWGRFVSALCLLPFRKTEDFSDDNTDTESSESETEVLVKKSFSPTANARLQHFQNKTRNHRLIKILKVENRYQVVHFDVYTMEDSQIFEIIPPAEEVPRDFAVQSCSQCAILWDKPTPGERPTEDAHVVTYTIDTRIQDTVYEQKNVWPKSGKPARTDGESDDDDAPETLPERIAFFKDGRRIKMYGAGGVVPYQIFSTSTTQYDQYASTNVISFDGFSVHVDTPFFGTHTTQFDELNQQSYCFQHHLCLGVATINLSNGPSDDEVKVLCILRSQNRYYSDGCEHRVNLSRMTHVSANNSTVVARLWGWEEMHTSFSGKETVAVSPGGTKIAIAMWNKVLVYHLNPKVLCDEVVVDSSDDEAPKLKKKKKKLRKSWETACTDYYQRKRDKNFLWWKIAELRPIVLDLQGAVAHKMSWSPAKGPITDTEESVATSVPDIDNPENDAPIDDGEQVEPSDDQVNASVMTQEGVIQEPESSSAASQTSPAPPVAGINGEGTTLNAAEAEPSQHIDGDGSAPQAADGNGQAPPEHADASNVAAVPSTNTPPGQVSPPEPQSPLVATKKSEVSQSPANLGNSVPSSPPPTLSTLPNTLPSSPFSLYGTQNPSQPSKPSTRKKEKALEVNNTDVNSLTNLEKKFQSAFSLGSGDTNVNQEQQAPWPSPNKVGSKPSQTVAEALAGAPPQVVASSTGNLAPFTTVPAIVSDTTIGEQATGVIPYSATEVASAVTKAEEEEESAASNPSKNPSAVAPSYTKNSEDTEDKDEADAAKSNLRRKRITEDELIILTDRSIQVWNVGARAKGKRKKSYLKLEESLKGKLPRAKGKRKETITPVDEEEA